MFCWFCPAGGDTSSLSRLVATLVVLNRSLIFDEQKFLFCPKVPPQSSKRVFLNMSVHQGVVLNWLISSRPTQVVTFPSVLSSVVTIQERSHQRTMEAFIDPFYCTCGSEPFLDLFSLHMEAESGQNHAESWQNRSRASDQNSGL